MLAGTAPVSPQELRRGDQVLWEDESLTGFIRAETEGDTTYVYTVAGVMRVPLGQPVYRVDLREWKVER